MCRLPDYVESVPAENFRAPPPDCCASDVKPEDRAGSRAAIDDSNFRLHFVPAFIPASVMAMILVHAPFAPFWSHWALPASALRYFCRGLRGLSDNASRATFYQRTTSLKHSLSSRAGLLCLIALQGVSAKRIDRVIKSEVSRYSR